MSSLQPRSMGNIPASGAPGSPELSPSLPHHTSTMESSEVASFQYGGLTTQDNASCNAFGLYTSPSPCSSIPSPPQSPLLCSCGSLATLASSMTLPSYDSCKTEAGITCRKRANNSSSGTLEYLSCPTAPSFPSPSPCNGLNLHHLPLEVQLGTDFILFPSGPGTAAFRDQASSHRQSLHSLYPTYSIPPIRCPPTPQSPIMSSMDNVPQEAYPTCSCGVMATLACQLAHAQQHMSYASEIARLPTPDLDDAPEGMFPEW